MNFSKSLTALLIYFNKGIVVNLFHDGDSHKFSAIRGHKFYKNSVENT